MSDRPRARSVLIASTRWIAPCQERNAPANTATVVGAGRTNGSVAGGAGTKAIGVGAPLEHANLFAGGVAGGRMAALGVTMRSAISQSRSRQRRIGSTSSARSSSALGDPGWSIDRRVHLEHGERAQPPRRRESPRRRSCGTAP